MRVTLTAGLACTASVLGAVALTPSARASSTSSKPLQIVGTPVVVYYEGHNGKDRTKAVTYQFRTNRRMRSNWEVRLSGMFPVFVNRGSADTCYSGQFAVGGGQGMNIYRAMRPGKLMTLAAQEFLPFREARRGVRVQRASGQKDVVARAARGCRS